MKVLVFLVLVLTASGCATKNSEGESEVPAPPPANLVSANLCQATYGEKVRAKVIEAPRPAGSQTFYCEYEESDPEHKFLPKLRETLEKKVRAKDNADSMMLSQQMNEIISNYLKGKCPTEWTANIRTEPLGWHCRSEVLPISRACRKGHPRVEKPLDGQEFVLCVSDS